MWREVDDGEIFKRFWIDETANTPRHFQDGTNAWHTSLEDFLDFCSRSWKVYLVGDNCLVYVEKDGKCANLHISFLRGSDAWVLMPDLIQLRNEILKDFELLYAWIGRHNRGLKKMVNALGMHYQGYSMWFGESHGKTLEWQNHSIARSEVIVAKDSRKLLVSV